MFNIPKISGQSLAGLAYKHLGSASRFREIAELNNIDVLKDKSFNELKSILIPSKDGLDLKKVAVPLLQGIADDLLQESGLPSASTIAGYVTRRDLKGGLQEATGLIQDRKVSEGIEHLIDWFL